VDIVTYVSGVFDDYSPRYPSWTKTTRAENDANRRLWEYRFLRDDRRGWSRNKSVGTKRKHGRNVDTLVNDVKTLFLKKFFFVKMNNDNSSILSSDRFNESRITCLYIYIMCVTRLQFWTSSSYRYLDERFLAFRCTVHTALVAKHVVVVSKDGTVHFAKKGITIFSG